MSEEEHIILMTREQSSMVSTWNEMLCLNRLASGKWYIGVYGYEVLGSIDDLVPEDERQYDEDGRIIVPDEIDGRRVLGLEDGEYVQTDQLVEREIGVEFDATDVEAARDYIRDDGWDKYEEFQAAWDRLNKLVNK